MKRWLVLSAALTTLLFPSTGWAECYGDSAQVVIDCLNQAMNGNGIGELEDLLAPDFVQLYTGPGPNPPSNSRTDWLETTRKILLEAMVGGPKFAGFDFRMWRSDSSTVVAIADGWRIDGLMCKTEVSYYPEPKTVDGVRTGSGQLTRAILFKVVTLYVRSRRPPNTAESYWQIYRWEEGEANQIQ
ncbi:MAG: hypothetical protein PHI73_05330 [Patescibacteria group bacterium]|nr:hypothetical protein [Patescibacteria group bacterium]